MAEYWGETTRDTDRLQAAKILQDRHAQQLAAMQEPVTHLQACTAMVTQMVATLHRNYHADPTGGVKESVDLNSEKMAVEELDGFITRAINAGGDDFSYLTPLRERLALCFNRASLEMQKPVSLRCNSYQYRNDNTGAKYDETFYIEISEKTAHNIKKIEAAQKPKEASRDPLTYKPRLPAKP